MSPADLRLRTMTLEEKRQLLQRAMARRPEPAPAARPGLWVRALAGRPHARRRLVCFAHGGGGATSYRAWPDLLPPDFEPLAVQLPGRESRAAEPFAGSLDEAAAAIAAEVAEARDRPVVLYGHSLGGALAWATAQTLAERHGLLPEAVVLAAIPPPGAPNGFEPGEDGLLEDDLIAAAGIDMRHVADDPSARAHLLARAAADRALMAGRSARAAAPLATRIVALAGSEDGTVPAGAMAAWAGLAGGGFELRVLPGPHLFHLTDPAGVVEAVCRTTGGAPLRSRLGARPVAVAPRPKVGVSLFFFSADGEAADGDRYRLFDSAVQYADRAGLEAVWIPERHFHPVGGPFPNPSVLAAAVAASTRRLRIRSGSVVLPLHDPIRVAEEWAMVDNISGGRVDLGVVPGWNPNDYVLAPDAYADRWAEVFRRLDIVRRLWRGEAVERTNGRGEAAAIRLHPRPVQPEPGLWIATSANDASFVRAGELGLNVLTALLIQTVDEFAGRVRLYRAAREGAGHDPDGGKVTLMVQTCVGATDAAARAAVRDPFIGYMRSVQSLWQQTVDGLAVAPGASQEMLEEVIFERYWQKSTLFGSLDTCLERARGLVRAGATEIACMIDFGVPQAESLASLAGIARLAEALAAGVEP